MSAFGLPSLSEGHGMHTRNPKKIRTLDAPGTAPKKNYLLDFDL